MALDYVGELERATRRRFECASITAQVEAVRAGAGIGVLHDYAAGQMDDLVGVLPEFSVQRSYWLVTHNDHRSLRRPFTALSWSRFAGSGMKIAHWIEATNIHLTPKG